MNQNDSQDTGNQTEQANQLTDLEAPDAAQVKGGPVLVDVAGNGFALTGAGAATGGTNTSNTYQGATTIQQGVLNIK